MWTCLSGMGPRHETTPASVRRRFAPSSGAFLHQVAASPCCSLKTILVTAFLPIAAWSRTVRPAVDLSGAARNRSTSNSEKLAS
jgi:hypothetical protein